MGADSELVKSPPKEKSKGVNVVKNMNFGYGVADKSKSDVSNTSKY